jgi:hypothetical protein
MNGTILLTPKEFFVPETDHTPLARAPKPVNDWLKAVSNEGHFTTADVTVLQLLSHLALLLGDSNIIL